MLGGARLIYGPLAGAIIVNFLPEMMKLDPIDSRIAYGVGLLHRNPAASGRGQRRSFGCIPMAHVKTSGSIKGGRVLWPTLDRLRGYVRNLEE